MGYEETVRNYLDRLDSYIRAPLATGEATPELSYRPVLDGFIREISALYSRDVEVIFEPKCQGHAGRPDWRLYNKSDMGLYGYVEAKALDQSNPINISPHMEQLTKYLSTGYRVILTDGLEFIFFEPDNIEMPHRHCLVEKPLCRGIVAEARIDFFMEQRLREFFKESGFRQCSEEQLIREMAIRASRLSECVLALSQAPPGSGLTESENRTIEILRNLQTTLRLHHDPVLMHPKVFADFVSQVLSFGLLYAHRVVAGEHGQPRDRYDAIQRFWTNAVYASYTDRLIPFKTLVEMLQSELSPDTEASSQLRCWYDDARRLLAHVQLRDRQREVPDYHTLYERFLAEFDTKTRFDFGSFCTPQELASFTVGMANAIIEKRFQGRHLYEEGNKVIDPCCGTGTFIEQLVRRSANRDPVHIVGFEILPAPYALAHYRTVMLDVPNTPQHVIDIFLTNTLSDEMERENDAHLESVLRDELRKARNCAKPPIMLVIGNPPSSDSFGPHSSGPNFSGIDRLLEDFRPPESDRRRRQNTQKQINNDFMKFVRWAANKVLDSEIGVLALVLPSTFATHPTYRYAREWLISHFAELWVLDIDRDLRTGVRSSSLFSSQQGRMLLIATYTGNAPATLDGRIYYAAITDKPRSQKKSFLNEERSDSEYMALFAQHSIDELTMSFRPVGGSYDRLLYSRFWAIHPEDQIPEPGERCIFLRHCSGTKLAPTSLFIHPKRPVLQRRSQDIGDMSKSFEDLNSQWFAGQSKPPTKQKLTPTVRSKIRDAAGIDGSFRDYAFRPFVSMQLLLDNELLRLLSGVGGGGTRLRPEIVSAYSNVGTIGIAIAPSPMDISDDLHRFATFCWDMPDNDLCSRGNAHVFCNQFPENKPPRGTAWDPTPKNNISEQLLSRVKSIFPKVTSSDIVYYVYAVLCSGTLLEAFASAYFTASSSENIARVPIVSDAGSLRSLIEKGRELATLENPRQSQELHALFSPFEALFVNSFVLKKFKVDMEQLEVRLYSDRSEPEIVLSGIPQELLQLVVSGYQVVSCWLKFHSYAYTRTQFNQDDFRQLLDLLSILFKQLEIIKEVDAYMEKVISGKLDLL